MFELTEPARAELDAYFDGKDKSSVRIFLSPGGCSGPRLSLALDEAGEADSVFNDKGYDFCMDKELYEAAKNIKVDFSDMGFMVDSDLQIEGGGDCSAGCSACCGH
ncbi:MAG: IscA/HesB family protein [Desulfovibrio sp.]|jgi:Fe-S cluster assembly iron-binding protein IscA|nr:IscA/HesB family protein [Desulfovibrio sp.]